MSLKLPALAPYIDRLKALRLRDDPEAVHFEADKVLCDLLEAAGAKVVVDYWRKLPRSYS